MCLNKFCQRLSQLVRRTFYFLSTLVAGRFWPLLDASGVGWSFGRFVCLPVGRLVCLSVCLSLACRLLVGWPTCCSMRCVGCCFCWQCSSGFLFLFFLLSLSVSIYLSLSVVLMQQISVGLKLYVPRSLCRGCRFSCPFTHFCLFALAFFGIIEVQLS